MSDMNDLVVYKTSVKERDIFYERRSPTEKRILIFKSDACTGCGICVDVCPREAIEINVIGASQSLNAPKLIFDPEKCYLCGICYNFCPVGAIDFKIEGSSTKNIKRTSLGKFTFIQEKCDFKDEEKKIMCDDCEKVCPRSAIKATVENNRNTIKHDDNACVRCGTCALTCPRDAIEVTKLFLGEISVDLEKCQACGVCVEVCPTNSITMPKKNPWERTDKIVINDVTCIYCKACMNACPVNAIEVKRKAANIEVDEHAPNYKALENSIEKLLED